MNLLTLKGEIKGETSEHSRHRPHLCSEPSALGKLALPVGPQWVHAQQRCSPALGLCVAVPAAGRTGCFQRGIEGLVRG